MSSIKANDPNLKSWLDISPESDFSIQNIPFGIVKSSGLNPRVASRLGDTVIDISKLFELGYLNGLGFQLEDFNAPFLNTMMKKGKKATRLLRNRLSALFTDSNSELRDNKADQEQILIGIDQVETQMPVKIGDYTDFYSSIEHATNVGTMFRDPNNALLPNWKHIPVRISRKSFIYCIVWN